MSQLILVRHGQASLFSDDYDRLSEIGKQQAQALANFWIGRSVQFDKVYVGPRRRQIDTALIIKAAYQQAGLFCPDLVTLAGLDEYNADAVMSTYIPILAARDPAIKILVDNFHQATIAERHKHFQKMFATVMLAWVQGLVQDESVETWEMFYERVLNIINDIQQDNVKGQRIALFTSGGPISVATHAATKAPPEMVLEFNWRLRNCSVTEIAFTQGLFTLDSFNSIAHLSQPELWTYR